MSSKHHICPIEVENNKLLLESYGVLVKELKSLFISILRARDFGSSLLFRLVIKPDFGEFFC
jgi:hypothetical protein